MEYNLALRFSVNKQISMIMADNNWTFIVGYKRSLLVGYVKNS